MKLQYRLGLMDSQLKRPTEDWFGYGDCRRLIICTKMEKQCDAHNGDSKDGKKVI